MKERSSGSGALFFGIFFPFTGKGFLLISHGALLNCTEKGIYSQISEGGLKISGGDQQRLSITRALIRNPRLLIFDQAALDSLDGRRNYRYHPGEIDAARADNLTDCPPAFHHPVRPSHLWAGARQNH
jgi:hypothetical protein